MMAFLKHLVIDENTVILTDLDGTLLKLLHDPKMRRIDPHAFEAFKKFNVHYPNQIIPITGRDYEQVYDCFNGTHSPFPVISSNGAEIRLPNGEEVTYPFTQEEINFIDFMRKKMAEFQNKNPWLVTEVKRFEVGFHSLPVQGYGEGNHCQDELLDKVRLSSERAVSLLQDIHEIAVHKGLDFVLAGAELTNRAICHSKIDKVHSIGWFQDYLPACLKGDDWSNVIYCGDGLASGNDRQIAKLVKSRGGVIFQVTNEANHCIPYEGDKAEPHFAVETPGQLGRLLLRRVNEHFAQKHTRG